jgi:hypothetical protein
MRLQTSPTGSALSQTTLCVCDATDIVGDCVYVSGPPIDGYPKVSKCLITSTTRMPVIGILIKKYDVTSGLLATGGLITYPDPLTPGLLYWVSTIGRLTSTVPTPATAYWYLQEVGEALTSSVLQLQLRLPFRRYSTTILGHNATRIGTDGLLEEFNLHAKERWQIALIGTYNGSNRTFLLPEVALYDPPTYKIRIYHGGRRVQETEFTVTETTPGSGYDRIHLHFTPQTASQLYADYVAA